MSALDAFDHPSGTRFARANDCARADEVAGRGDERQGFERLANERLRARRRAPGPADRAPTPRAPDTCRRAARTESQAGAAADHEIDDREVDALFARRRRSASATVRHDVDVVALGAQEVLGELGRVRVAFDEQDACAPRVRPRSAPELRIAGEALGERPMRVGGAQARAASARQTKRSWSRSSREYSRCDPALRSGTTTP